jgi:predicted ATPase
MDLFLDSVPSRVRQKRVHFHSFMLDVHSRIHALNSQEGGFGGDPLPIVAHAIAQEAWLLCFDEFQVLLTTLIHHDL